MLDDNLLLSKLLEMGLVDHKRADLGRSLSRENDVSLYDTLVWKNLVEEGPFVDVVAELIQIPSAKLADVEIEDDVKALVPGDLAVRHRAMPIEFRYIGGIKQLVVGMVNPKDSEALDEIASVAGQKVRPLLVGPVDLSRALEEHFECVDVQKPNFESSGAVDVVESDLSEMPELDISDMELLDEGVDVSIELSIGDGGSHAEILSSDAARTFYDGEQEVSEPTEGNHLSSATGSVAEHTDKFEPVDKTAVRFGFVQGVGESDAELVVTDAPDEVDSEHVEESDASAVSEEAEAERSGTKTGPSGGLGSTGTDFAMVEEVSGSELPALALDEKPKSQSVEKTDYRAVGRTILKSGKAKRSKKSVAKRNAESAKKSGAKTRKTKSSQSQDKSNSLSLDEIPTDVLVKALFQALIAGGLIEEDVIRAVLDEVMNQK